MNYRKTSWDLGLWLKQRGVHPDAQQGSAFKKRLLAVQKSGSPVGPDKWAGGRNAQDLPRAFSVLGLSCLRSYTLGSRPEMESPRVNLQGFFHRGLAKMTKERP